MLLVRLVACVVCACEDSTHNDNSALSHTVSVPQPPRHTDTIKGNKSQHTHTHTHTCSLDKHIIAPLSLPAAQQPYTTHHSASSAGNNSSDDSSDAFKHSLLDKVLPVNGSSAQAH